ncbi:hypothetical protein OG909_12600 [Streptomyces sp. NBC_01754]|uniref:hypothetical protein n=1 Tax=Streptomyces sp. NBC_01754 TaxID=2975930 RepID=UPI002DD83256|nr:hypothetical protein [Streptomyces sp. NBC_01754]WSC93064.1 hypothetical protein OG909_12600 [Streptomyces sp. NBC_01754]
MIIAKQPRPSFVSRAWTGVTIAILGMGLAGCATGDPSPAATAESQSSETSQNTRPPSADESSSANANDASGAAAEQTVTLTVQGEKRNALVKTLVITADGKETGGRMVNESLPFSKKVTLPTATEFTKILIIAKYPDGAIGELSCDVSVDGKSLVGNTSTTHKPAECLFVTK